MEKIYLNNFFDRLSNSPDIIKSKCNKKNTA